jgi:hypothetical protein
VLATEVLAGVRVLAEAQVLAGAQVLMVPRMLDRPAPQVLMAPQMLDRRALKQALAGIKRAPGKLAGAVVKGLELARGQARELRGLGGRMMGWRARRLRLATPAWAERLPLAAVPVARARVERLPLAAVPAARARVERPPLAVVPVVRVLAQRLPRPERLLRAAPARGITTNSITIAGIVIKARRAPRLRMPTRRVVTPQRAPKGAVGLVMAPEAGMLLARATAPAAGREVHALLPGSGCCAKGN